MTKAIVLKTGDMAQVIGHSTKWLKERKDVDFIKGVHYQQRDDLSYPVWEVKEVLAWFRSQDTNKDIDLILNNVLQ